VLLAILYSAWIHATTTDRIAAIVNDEVITLSEIYELGSEYISEEALTPDARREAEISVLDSLILRVLITQELIRLQIDVSDQELSDAVDEVASNNGLNLEELKKEILNSGLEWELYQVQLKESLRQMKFNQAILQPRIQVEEDALLDMYQRNIRAMDKTMVVDLGAIFLKGPPTFRTAKQVAAENGSSVEEAQQLIDEALSSHSQSRSQKLLAIQSLLDSGTPFEEIVSQYDEGGFDTSEGKMGVFPEGQLREDLNEPAFSVPIGQFSDPIDTEKGTFVLYIIDRRPQGAPPFEEMRGQLLDEYYDVRFEREMDVWFSQAKRRAHIQVKLEPPQTL
jgi:peptidyl-prolyl cis-trans isomerase SurA